MWSMSWHHQLASVGRPLTAAFPSHLPFLFPPTPIPLPHSPPPPLVSPPSSLPLGSASMPCYSMPPMRGCQSPTRPGLHPPSSPSCLTGVSTGISCVCMPQLRRTTHCVHMCIALLLHLRTPATPIVYLQRDTAHTYTVACTHAHTHTQSFCSLTLL